MTVFRSFRFNSLCYSKGSPGQWRFHISMEFFHAAGCQCKHFSIDIPPINACLSITFNEARGALHGKDSDYSQSLLP